MINTELIQSYIAYKAPSPLPMVVLIDPSSILILSGSISILDRQYEIIVYENDLQIRNAIENYKDDLQGNKFCIISSKSDEENLYISDYMARSSVIVINPQVLMEFFQSGYNWTEDINQLQGLDFWNYIDRLKKFRESFQGYISSSECINVILSAILNIDLSKSLLPALALNLQRKMETDETISYVRRKYPKLIKSLEQIIQDSIPLMVRVDQDEEFTKFSWLSYALSQHSKKYDLLMQRILGQEIWQKFGEIPTDDAEEICRQMIEHDHVRAIEQVKLVEDWFIQNEERMHIFKSWLGLGTNNIIKSAEYAAKESCFCITLKESLKTVARAMVSSQDKFIITNQLRNEIIKNITSKHLFLKDDSSYMKIRDTFEEFSWLCEYQDLINEIKKKEWWNKKEKRDNIELWTKEIYPNYVSRIELLRDRIETLNFRCDLLSSALLQKVIDEAKLILNVFSESFSELIQKHYPLWVMNIEQPKPFLTTDFISQIFKPFFSKYIKNREQSVYIVVFDGMRWDEWEILKPKIMKIFQGKMAMEDVIPLIAILPSTTQWARSAIFAGDFPKNFSAENEDDLLKSALGTTDVAKIQMSAESPDQRDNVLSFLEDTSQIKPIIFNLIDIKLHSTTQNLVTLYEEVEINFVNTIGPYLEKIPSDSLVFIVSDHGFIELNGKPILAPSREISDPHRRYIGLKSFTSPDNISTSDFVFFDANNILMPANTEIIRYGFAKPNRFIISQKEQTSKTVRYAHGGISMQEMIVPCAIFTPKSKGQLTMF